MKLKTVLTISLVISILFNLNAATVEWDQFIASPEHAQIISTALKFRGPFQETDEEEFIQALPEFSQNNSLIDASHLALAKILGPEASRLTIDIKQGNIEDPAKDMQDIVMLCKNGDEKIELVIKWFLSPSFLAKELSAMEKLHSLPLTYSRVISPIAVGKAQQNQATYYLLVETPAAGQPLRDIVETIAKTKNSARDEALALFEKALLTQAKAIGELNSFYMEADRQAEDDYTKMQNTRIAETIKKLNAFSLGPDLTPHIEEMKKREALLPKYKRFNHGDAHWGNLFYDKADESLTFIDLNFMHNSIAADGTPDCPRLSDYALFIRELFITEDIFKEEDRNRFKEIFNKTYLESTNGTVILEELAYVEMKEIMIILSIIFQNDPKQIAEKQDYIAYLIEHLRTIQAL